jgi:hypothetical protein
MAQAPASARERTLRKNMSPFGTGLRQINDSQILQGSNASQPPLGL